MGSSSVWGDIWGFTVTEYVRSRDSGIFQRWWAKVVSPYSHTLADHSQSSRVECSHMASMTFTIPFLEPLLMSKTPNGLTSVFCTFNGWSEGIIFLISSKNLAPSFQLLLSGLYCTNISAIRQVNAFFRCLSSSHEGRISSNVPSNCHLQRLSGFKVFSLSYIKAFFVDGQNCAVGCMYHLVLICYSLLKLSKVNIDIVKGGAEEMTTLHQLSSMGDCMIVTFP